MVFVFFREQFLPVFVLGGDWYHLSSPRPGEGKIGVVCPVLVLGGDLCCSPSAHLWGMVGAVRPVLVLGSDGCCSHSAAPGGGGVMLVHCLSWEVIREVHPGGEGACSQQAAVRLTSPSPI